LGPLLRIVKGGRNVLARCGGKLIHRSNPGACCEGGGVPGAWIVAVKCAGELDGPDEIYIDSIVFSPTLFPDRPTCGVVPLLPDESTCYIVSKFNTTDTPPGPGDLIITVLPDNFGEVTECCDCVDGCTKTVIPEDSNCVGQAELECCCDVCNFDVELKIYENSYEERVDAGDGVEFFFSIVYEMLFPPTLSVRNCVAVSASDGLVRRTETSIETLNGAVVQEIVNVTEVPIQELGNADTGAYIDNAVCGRFTGLVGVLATGPNGECIESWTEVLPDGDTIDGQVSTEITCIRAASLLNLIKTDNSEPMPGTSREWWELNQRWEWESLPVYGRCVDGCGPTAAAIAVGTTGIAALDSAIGLA